MKKLWAMTLGIFAVLFVIAYFDNLQYRGDTGLNESDLGSIQSVRAQVAERNARLGMTSATEDELLTMQGQAMEAVRPSVRR